VAAQQSTSGPKGAAGGAKVDNNQQLTYVFKQELDSKDKIAMRLQPYERKYSFSSLAASRPLTRSSFALARTALVLGLKGLAIMNFS
jgi:hypothetical protein